MSPHNIHQDNDIHTHSQHPPEVLFLRGQGLVTDCHSNHDFHSELVSTELHRHSRIDICIDKLYDCNLDFSQLSSCIFYIVYTLNFPQRKLPHADHNHPHEQPANISHKITSDIDRIP